LGDWSPATAPGLVPAAGDGDGALAVTLSLPPGEAVEYKYARVDAAAGTVTWEGGGNRRLHVTPGAIVAEAWVGGESPPQPCDGIEVPPPVEAAAAAAVEAADPPAAADGGAADAPAPPAPADEVGDAQPGAPVDAPVEAAAPPPPAEAAAEAATSADATPTSDNVPAAGASPGKKEGDVNLFKHLSSGVSSLLRALGGGDRQGDGHDVASAQPPNGVAQAES